MLYSASSLPCFLLALLLFHRSMFFVFVRPSLSLYAKKFLLSGNGVSVSDNAIDTAALCASIKAWIVNSLTNFLSRISGMMQKRHHRAAISETLTPSFYLPHCLVSWLLMGPLQAHKTEMVEFGPASECEFLPGSWHQLDVDRKPRRSNPNFLFLTCRVRKVLTYCFMSASMWMDDKILPDSKRQDFETFGRYYSI